MVLEHCQLEIALLYAPKRNEKKMHFNVVNQSNKNMDIPLLLIKHIGEHINTTHSVADTYNILLKNVKMWPVE